MKAIYFSQNRAIFNWLPKYERKDSASWPNELLAVKKITWFDTQGIGNLLSFVIISIILFIPKASNHEVFSIRENSWKKLT